MRVAARKSNFVMTSLAAMLLALALVLPAADPAAGQAEASDITLTSVYMVEAPMPPPPPDPIDPEGHAGQPPSEWDEDVLLEADPEAGSYAPRGIQCYAKSRTPRTVGDIFVYGQADTNCTSAMMTLSVHVALWRWDSNSWTLVDTAIGSVSWASSIVKPVTVSCRNPVQAGYYAVTASHLMTPPLGYRPAFRISFTRSNTDLFWC